MILLMFCVMFGLIACELPIAFALIVAAFFYLFVGTPIPPSIVVQRMSTGIDSFPLLAIPLFVLAGNLLNTGGISRGLFEILDRTDRTLSRRTRAGRRFSRA